MDWKKAEEKARPIINNALQQAENEGLTYEEMSYLCRELQDAVSKQSVQYAKLPFSTKSIENF